MKTYLKEMLSRKDLLYYLVRSGLKAEHRNSYLGYLWWLLDPLLNVLVFYFLIVVILDRGDTENFPLFLVIGLIVWRCISTTLNSSSGSIMRYSSIVSQVYLPKSLFPISFTLTQLFNFSFGFIVIAGFLAWFRVMPGWEIVFLPLLIIIQTTFLLAIGMILAYVTVFVRDIENVLQYVTRAFFYASPIIWEGGRLPPEYGWAVTYNPIAVIVTAYRDILMYASLPNFLGLGIIFVISAAVIVFMIWYYSKNEYKIIKAM
ncbi:ABC transporter permease [Lacicoccus qingdaonensis]|uniref:Transport permease protein n=1 Tax=Lacicoccus qingdaonensis TaxID=576118 RepID=A0A1G9F7A0_9BACL|nr:ABC transporter permease [Salinicoccus qingdaonensis]SDK84225.1 lipopolysaccharide transport system permease protein/teichoic acid transport system permease protein [Salinicoccus qingdaonensis]